VTGEGKEEINGEDDLPELGKGATACLRLDEGTPQHALDGRADESGLAEDDKLKAIARDERDVLAVRHHSVRLGERGVMEETSLENSANRPSDE
jgi:hypothetical protein